MGWARGSKRGYYENSKYSDCKRVWCDDDGVDDDDSHDDDGSGDDVVNDDDNDDDDGGGNDGVDDADKDDDGGGVPCDPWVRVADRDNLALCTTWPGTQHHHENMSRRMCRWSR